MRVRGLRRVPDGSPPRRGRPGAAPRPGSRPVTRSSGVVDRLGPGSTRWQEGDRIGVPWLAHTCGVCRFCVSGRENLCVRPRFTGWDVDGGYAAYTVVDEDYAYALPDVFDDVEVAPLLCAGIIGYRALLRANLPDGGRLGIYGFGGSAHLTAQVALARGARVHVMTRSAGGAAAGPRARCRQRRGRRRRTPRAAGLRHPVRTGRHAGAAGPGRPGPGRHAGHRRHLPQRHPCPPLPGAPLRGAGAPERDGQHPAGRGGIPGRGGPDRHPRLGRPLPDGPGRRRAARTCDDDRVNGAAVLVS